MTEFAHHETNHYPLSVQAIPGDELTLRIEYDTDVFDTAGIDALSARLQRVLAEMIADPGRPMFRLDLLDDCEHVRLDEWSNRAVLTRPAPVSLTIPALFAAQVERDPKATALSHGGRSWTYRELDDAANRFAHLLAGRGGIGPGQRVAMVLPRSAEAIVSILAVLKTGAAYVPIDPAAPSARMHLVLADAEPAVVITIPALADRLAGQNLPVIDVNDPAVQSQPSTALPGPAPDDIAYLIYTSGTTGIPKGVAIDHRNVAQLMDSLQAAPPAVATSVVAVPFLRLRRLGPRDLRCADRRRSVGHRARVGGPRAGRSSGPSGFRGVSVFSTTPSEVGMLSPDILESVALIIGAEACPTTLMDQWAPGRVMINAYGPTETTVDVASVRR